MCGANPAATARRSRPRLTRTTTFGNLVIVLFLVAQAIDGGFTYLGVITFGPAIEANPLLAWLMAAVGEARRSPAPSSRPSAFGMILHLAAVHRALALLTAIYLSAAVVPWLTLLWLAGSLVDVVNRKSRGLHLPPHTHSMRSDPLGILCPPSSTP